MTQWLSSPVFWIVFTPLLLILLTALRRPLRLLIHLLARSLGSLAALAVFQPVSAFLGIPLGINCLNAIVLGILGIPGLGLLLMLRWLLGSR